MPVFTDLDVRVANPPFDSVACELRLVACRLVAEAVHLVHVSGRERPFEMTVQAPSHAIPTSDDHGYCSDFTRTAENHLGLRPSAYFYAGRANPSFGNVAMAFSPECETAHTGSVTPFDTGGLVHPRQFIKVQLNPTDGLEERIGYGKSSEIALNQWRDVFAHVLAAYFETAADYWFRRPSMPDPEGLYESNTDWRAWTFEVRFCESQSVLERTAWCGDESVMVILRRELDTQGPTPPGDAPTPLDQFLQGPVALIPAGTPDFCDRLENWVRERILP